MLGEVEVGLVLLAIEVAELGTENGDVVIALEGEFDVLSRVGEVWQISVSNRGDVRLGNLTLTTPLEGAVVVANKTVEVNLSINFLAVSVGELALEDVAVVELKVLGAKVESHCVLWWGFFVVSCGEEVVVSAGVDEELERQRRRGLYL